MGFFSGVAYFDPQGFRNPKTGFFLRSFYLRGIRGIPFASLNQQAHEEHPE